MNIKIKKLTSISDSTANVVAKSVPKNGTVHTTERPVKFNIAINGFRGVCVLLVFSYHVYHSGLLPTAAPQSLLGSAAAFFASSWRYGVELFFMISGYVIVNSLRRHRSVLSFLRDRCIRLFPVWVPIHVGIFVGGALTGWKIFHHMSISKMWMVFFANLLLLPPLIPLPVTHPASWSLSYEWLFYLFSAATFALYSRDQLTFQKRIPLWAALGAVALGTICLIPRSIFFLPGVIIALGWAPLDKWRTLLQWPMFSLLVFLLSWRVVDMDQAIPGAYSVLSLLTSAKLPFALLALLAGLHLFACICQEQKNVHWLHHPAAQFLGSISYSFYLWHPIVMFAVKRPVVMWVAPHTGAIAATAIFAVVSFMVALPISSLSYRLIEQRLARMLRKRFEYPQPILQRHEPADGIAMTARAEGR